MKYKHILLKSTEYKKLKAFQFFYEGFSKKVEVAISDDFCYFDVRMKASMRSNIYKVIVKLDVSSGNVCSAACTCPAGIGVGGFGNCNHVGGVLFGLEDFYRKCLKDSITPTSCTSKLSAWNVPHDSSSSPVTIDQVVIKKMKFGNDTEAECLPKMNLYDPCATCDRSVNSDQLSILKSTLQSSLSESCFFLLHDMNPYPPQGQPQELTEEIISMEPVPGISDHVVDCASSNSFNETPFNDFYDISSIKFKEMMDLHAAGSVSITQYQIHKIQIDTKGQSLSEAWFLHIGNTELQLQIFSLHPGILLNPLAN